MLLALRSTAHRGIRNPPLLGIRTLKDSARPSRPKLSLGCLIKRTHGGQNGIYASKASLRSYTTEPGPIASASSVVSQTTPGVAVTEMIVPEGPVVDQGTLQELVNVSRLVTEEALIPVTPETIALHMWLMLQHDFGIPLWAAMAVTTWGLRTAALPIFFAQVRNMATLSYLSPKIQALKQKISQQEQIGDEVMAQHHKEKLQSLYKTFNASPWKNFLTTFTIVPLMVAQAFSARYALGHTPQLLETSGPLWMSNLLISDPLYIAPFMYVGLQLLILRLNLPMQSGIIGDLKSVSKTSWALLAVYAAFLGFICYEFPAAISTLWLYSMSFTALSNAAMYLPFVRRKLGIATSLPTERPAHLPPVKENLAKESIAKELFREPKAQQS